MCSKENLRQGTAQLTVSGYQNTPLRQLVISSVQITGKLRLLWVRRTCGVEFNNSALLEKNKQNHRITEC